MCPEDVGVEERDTDRVHLSGGEVAMERVGGVKEVLRGGG